MLGSVYGAEESEFHASCVSYKMIRIYIAQIRKIQVGDKLAGRHGNKGIVSRILPQQDMPYLPAGTPIDIIFNPLGVPSRMNVGQVFECLLGFAGEKLGNRFLVSPFDEIYGKEASRILINQKLKEAAIKKNQNWIYNSIHPGKIMLKDGRTGEFFDNPITVGKSYILKLIHLVEDKIHARSTGPYAMITEQPLGGKSQKGGQRFGEMEVWALEAYGCSTTLQELLTIKSDDMQGRNDTLNAIVKGQTIPKSGIPESFKVLLQELRCIGLDISTYKLGKLNSKTKYDIEVSLMEKYNPSLKRFSPNANTNNLSFY
jgi:DNA-directed RNA polymerase subunit beta